MHKKGFTLAEVMVTLTVLGVLAAIIIPAVVNVKPNKNKIMFKKGYYIVEKIVSELVNDEDLYPESTDPLKVGLANDISVKNPGLTPTDALGASKFCTLMAAKLNTLGAIDCTATKNPASDKPNFETTDGIAWFFPIQAFVVGSNLTLTVDVNGILTDKNGNIIKTKQNPNCKEKDSNCSQPDQFEILINPTGKLSVPAGLETEYLKIDGVQ